MTTKRRSIQARVRRLTREISEIDDFFYGGIAGDSNRLFMLERKRDDVVRSAVLQLHTAVEDLLTSWITCRVLGVRPIDGRRARGRAAQALRRVMSGGGAIGFETKLGLAVALGLIRRRTESRLVQLNRLRNKCSHNWLLKAHVRRGVQPANRKPPLLEYAGRDLHAVDAIREFAGEFGLLYAKMFARYMAWRPRHPRR